MSFLGDLVGGAVSLAKNFFGGSSDSSGSGRDRDYGGSYSKISSTMTNYDPDKVEVAKLENERVNLVKNAQLELMEVNARLEAVMIEARCKGFQAMQISMLNMLKEVNQLAEERLVLLENGNQEQVQKIESMYAELSKDVNSNEFMLSSVPQMLEMLNKFTEGSDSYNLYKSGIDREMARSIDFKNEQLRGIAVRRKAVIDSVIASKEQMQTHIDNVISKRIEHLEQVMQVNAQFPHNTVSQLGTGNSGTSQLKIEKNS